MLVKKTPKRPKVMKGEEIIHKMFLHLQNFLLGWPRHRNLAEISSLSSRGSVLKLD